MDVRLRLLWVAVKEPDCWIERYESVECGEKPPRRAFPPAETPRPAAPRPAAPRARRHAVVSAEVLSLVKQEAGPQLTVRVGWREG